VSKVFFCMGGRVFFRVFFFFFWGRGGGGFFSAGRLVLFLGSLFFFFWVGLVGCWLLLLRGVGVFFLVALKFLFVGFFFGVFF